ncbi:unnamed protein product [Rotaria sp. Silwood1]|nr:unnamed protein product [Rotaria sp. Silwood1]
MDAMKSSHDKITFQSIEFWSNVCNEEYELQLLQQEHIQDVKHLFNRLLTIKSIPVVQQVYQAILADMTTNFNVLLQALQQKAIVVGSGTLSSPTTSDLNEDNAEVALIFDCSALCQIGNVKGNFIGMYALSPPLFQLLAKHLQLTNSKLARQYSAIHYGILKTLYSHCAAYEHFIHNSDLFKQNDTNNVMSLTSLTKDNFEDLLKLLHRLIVNSYLSCHDTNLETLQFFAWSIVNNTKTVESSSSEQTNRSLTPSSTTNLPVTSSSSSSSSSEVNLPTDKALKKCMYEGAALSLPQFPKTIKFFFITNKSTCLEWVNRIRIPIILTAVCSGQYESAVRNSNQCLMHVCALGKAEVYDCYLSLHQWPELITWNDTCIQMQIPFLQDHKKDLRITMKTTIDINAIRAMSYFENRDFYGLKVAMRKMPNSQAIGEELGRNISCSWDMEPFDTPFNFSTGATL